MTGKEMEIEMNLITLLHEIMMEVIVVEIHVKLIELPTPVTSNEEM